MDYRAPQPDAPLLVLSTRVTALNRHTGALVWTYEVDAATRRFAIEGERLFVFDGNGRLHCLELRTGRLIGRVDLGLSQANSMLVDGDRMYVSNDSTVIALDLNGQILWRADVPANGSYSLCGLGVPGGHLVQPDFSNRPG